MMLVFQPLADTGLVIPPFRFTFVAACYLFKESGRMQVFECNLARRALILIGKFSLLSPTFSAHDHSSGVAETNDHSEPDIFGRYLLDHVPHGLAGPDPIRAFRAMREQLPDHLIADFRTAVAAGERPSLVDPFLQVLLIDPSIRSRPGNSAGGLKQRVRRRRERGGALVGRVPAYWITRTAFLRSRGKLSKLVATSEAPRFVMSNRPASERLISRSYSRASRIAA